MKKGSRRLAIVLALCLVFTSIMTTPVAAKAKAKKPGKVVITSIFKFAPNKAQLTWDKVKNAKKYEVYASENGKKFKKVGTTKKLYFQHKKLKAGKTYKYKVRAVNGKKKGKYSAVKFIPRTIQEYMANNPGEAADAQAVASQKSDVPVTLSYVGNDIYYNYDLTALINTKMPNPTPEELANFGASLKAATAAQDVATLASASAQIEAVSYISGVRIINNYLYNGASIASQAFNRNGAL